MLNDHSNADAGHSSLGGRKASSQKTVCTSPFSACSLILSLAKSIHSSSPSSYTTKCLLMPSHSSTLPENLCNAYGTRMEQAASTWQNPSHAEYWLAQLTGIASAYASTAMHLIEVAQMLLVTHAMHDDLPCLFAIPVNLDSVANCSLPQCIGGLLLCL